jgi:hypothetical protein
MGQALGQCAKPGSDAARSASQEEHSIALQHRQEGAKQPLTAAETRHSLAQLCLEWVLLVFEHLHSIKGQDHPPLSRRCQFLGKDLV